VGAVKDILGNKTKTPQSSATTGRALDFAVGDPRDTAAGAAAAAANTTKPYEVHQDYRKGVLDYQVGDPRDLPAADAFEQSHYTVAYKGNTGFPGAGNGNTGDGFPDGVETVRGGSDGGYSAATSKVAPYEAAKLQAATSQEDYIKALYDANEQKQKAALEAEYDANVATLDRQAATIAPQYQQAANAAAAQSAVAQAAFNERAAAAGMNTGAGSQAALAQNNALQSNISSIRQAESEALAEVEAQRASLAQQYQKAIAEAVANNDAARAQALYAEAVRVDESLVSTAANQAADNFNAWQAMYKLAKGG
jgi:hypothetical protein